MKNNNTAWFGLTDMNVLVKLSEGADTTEVANLLGDAAESIAGVAGDPINIVALLNINDLYRLREAATTALNSLNNDVLAGENITFNTEVDFTD